MTRHRSLLRRVPRVGSPASQLLLRRSDARCPTPLGFRFARCSRPAAARGVRASQVPGLPLRTCRALRPRLAAALVPGQCERCCLPRAEECRPQRSVRFRGSITRPMRSLSTLRRPSHLVRRKTRLRLGHFLRRRAHVDARVPRGELRKVSGLTSLSPFPSFAWRTQHADDLGDLTRGWDGDRRRRCRTNTRTNDGGGGYVDAVRLRPPAFAL